jgi:7-cyano-7-deazaguanine synthase
MSEKRAMVLLSGGLDSTVSLFWAMRRFDDVVAISVDYGQRHVAELAAARRITRLTSVDHLVIKIPLGRSGVIGTGTKIIEARDSVVHGRNLAFIAVAATYAATSECATLVIGACLDDSIAYPDCRPRFLDAAGLAIREGMTPALGIDAPYANATKAEIVSDARSFGEVCWKAAGMSISCYEGLAPGCGGVCPACVARARGFDIAGERDPAK